MSVIAKNRVPLSIFLSTRIPLFLFAYATMATLPMSHGEGKWRAFPHNLFLDGWARWDSGWYREIADAGYKSLGTGAPGPEIAFFPLYPMLIRAGKGVFGDTFISGIVISNVCFLLALVVLYRLVRELYDESVGRRTLWLVCVFPFSFFFDAMYTESVFLLTSVLAFYLGEKRRWGLACLSAALAGAVRPNGFLVTFALMLLYLEQVEFRLSSLKRDFAWTFFGLLGPTSYFAYLSLASGDPAYWLRAQGAWSIHGGWAPLVELAQELFSWSGLLSGRCDVVSLLQLGALVFGFALCWIGYRAKMRISYVLWALANLVLAFSRWHSAGRFVAVLFPCFVALALWIDKREGALRSYLFASTLFLGLLTTLFTHWYWVL